MEELAVGAGQFFFMRGRLSGAGYRGYEVDRHEC